MPFYSKEDQEDVRAANDLFEVMREYGEIIRDRPGRKNAIWECNCAGRNTKNKSRLNKDAQLYNCFSCGRAGNVFGFVMEKEGIPFPAAVELLAARAKIPLHAVHEFNDEFKQASKAYEIAMLFFQSCLHQTTYFQKRGMDPEDIAFFKAGYAPGGSALANHMQLKGYDMNFLFEIGLVHIIDGVYKDSLFKRVVFPIYQNGYIRDIYGRRTDDLHKNKHHYINGDQICFNFDSVKPGQPVVIVESIFNATALYKQIENHPSFIRSFFKNGLSVWAIGGCTKFNDYHINLLKKKDIPLIFICYDPDLPEEGKMVARAQEEALRAGKLIQKKNMRTRIVEMPVQTDVNDFFVKEAGTIQSFFDRLTQSYDPLEYEHLLNLRKMPKDMIQSYLQGSFT